MLLHRLPRYRDDDVYADNLLTALMNPPMSTVLRRGIVWAGAQVAISVYFSTVLMIIVSTLLSLVSLLSGSQVIFGPWMVLIAWTVTGWMYAGVQAFLAEVIDLITLPHWRRIGLVTGLMAGLVTAVSIASHGQPETPPFRIVGFVTVIVVMTLLQMRSLSRLSRRAWLWGLTMPLAAWLAMEMLSRPGCGPIMTLFPLYHLAGGLVLGVIAQDARHKPKPKRDDLSAEEVSA